MLDTTVERRSALRRLLALATEVEVVELPPGATVFARTSDVSRTGCHVDTLNPLPNGSKVRRRVTHHDEVFEGRLPKNIESLYALHNRRLALTGQFETSAT
jgi:hypothetical protein